MPLLPRVAAGALVALALPLAGASSCSSDAPAAPPAPLACSAQTLGATFEPVGPADVAVYLDSQDPLLDPVAADLASYLSAVWSTPVTVARSAPDFSKKRTIWLSTSDAAAAKIGTPIADGYALERIADASGSASLVVYAKDAPNLAAGAYALLETLGVRFFHPKEELVPHRPSPALPRALDVQRAPLVQQRGLQFHTLHPIEYLATFNEPSDANLADAKKVIDWLVKTGQNYVQWALLSTVDFASWRPHAQAILDYAHSRGVRVGCVVQLWATAALQNNYDLVTNAATWQADMDGQLANLMTIPWDVVEIGLGEFRATDPQSVVTWLSHATAQVATLSPSTQVNAQNHVGYYPQLWVPYDGQTVYYYQLPQYSDSRLGMTVHTLAFFDLYRDWGMYAQPDYGIQHDFLLKELPSRRVTYFPESAYWVTVDISVPIFLPEYVLARWNDIHGLAGEIAAQHLPPMSGHVMFTSGHEWGYWMNDYLTAKMLWDPNTTVDALFADYASSYGDCAGEVAGALGKFTDLQTKYLFDDRLAPYVMGEDTTVDLGHVAGIPTIPRRVQFEDIVAMSEAERVDFEGSVLGELDDMTAAMTPLEDTVAADCARADADVTPWCDELWDGMAIVRLRAQHAAALYRATLAYARNDASAQSFYDQATGITTQAAAVIARREAHYRFDLNRVTGTDPNPTIYPFGYLRQAHTQCFFQRREAQVASFLQDGIPPSVLNLPTCDK
ncbi:MAG TPA: hypothetical protein VGI39_26000 [Polyangiaceae bacterium]